MTDRALAGAIDSLLPWATDLLRRLVAEPSITGQEHAAQAIVTSSLSELSMDVDTWCPRLADVAEHPSFSDDGLPLGDRPVVVGTWGTDTDRPTVTLNGHIDVVPAGDVTRWPYDPWSGEVVDGRVHGRGTCDMKGGLVAGLLAVAALKNAGLEPAVNVAVQSVIGEETGGVGTLAAVLRGHVGDAAVIMEPTRMDRCPVGAGSASFRLHVHGRAAHGAMREQGVSAIERFVELWAAISALESARHERFDHPAFTDGSLVAPISIGRLEAGDWPSTVPESLVAEGRFGVLPGETLADAYRALEQCVATRTSGPGWSGLAAPTIEWFEGQFEPAATPLDAPLVEALGRTHGEVVGRPSAVRGVPYGSDLRFFTNDAGVPAVLYGPGDPSLAHSVGEHVSLGEVRDVALVLALMLLRGEGM